MLIEMVRAALAARSPRGKRGRPARRQFSLRTLFIGIAVIAVCFAALVSPARRQQRLVRNLEDMGGYVHYDAPYYGWEHTETTWRTWVAKKFGPDFVYDINEIRLPPSPALLAQNPHALP